MDCLGSALAITTINNLWGAFIGRPGMLKSPAMGEALKPIHHLEADAAKDNEIAQQAYAAEVDAYRLRQQVRSLSKRMRSRRTRKTLKMLASALVTSGATRPRCAPSRRCRKACSALAICPGSSSSAHKAVSYMMPAFRTAASTFGRNLAVVRSHRQAASSTPDSWPQFSFSQRESLIHPSSV
jgi:hypothetical protein